MKKHEFTLIEMLVVIVIVVVFFSCISGFLETKRDAARETAYRISCTSNLKQIGTSIKQYAMDYDDRFPIGTTDGTYGLELLRKHGYLPHEGWEKGKSIESQEGRPFSVYCCPSTQTPRGAGSDVLTQGTAGANVDYAFAAGLQEGNSARFGNPESAMASDIINTSVAQTNGSPDADKPNHENYGNILFHDAHITGFAGADWYSRENRGSSYMWPNMYE